MTGFLKLFNSISLFLYYYTNIQQINDNTKKTPTNLIEGVKNLTD